LKTVLKCKFIPCILFLSMSVSAVTLAAEDEPSGRIYMQPANEQASGYFVVEGEPGERKQVTVLLQNESDELPATADLFAADAVTAQGGGMGAITPDSAERTRMGGWFQNGSHAIRLQPGERKEVAFPFTIPADARPGDHIGAIVLYKFVPASAPEAAPGANKAQIVVNKAYTQSIAVVVRVPGEYERKLKVESVEPVWNGANLFLKLSIANIGNKIQKSQGTIAIVDKNGQELYATAGKMESIYPGTSGAFLFQAPDALKTLKEYDVQVQWQDTEGVRNEEETFRIRLAAKDRNRAKVTELATNHPDQTFAADSIVLDRKQLVVYASVFFAIVMAAVFLLMLLFRRRSRTEK
jgi:hypothetical protein